MNKKCPVCGHTALRRFGVYGDQLQCGLCGTTDAASKFLPIPPWDQQFVAEIKPLPEEFDAVVNHPAVIETYCPPTLNLEQIRALASAFRLDLMPRVTDEKREDIARKICAYLGPGWPFADDDDKAQCFGIVNLVGNALLQD